MEIKGFQDNDIGISGVFPASWALAQPGVWARHASEGDPTQIAQQRVNGWSVAEALANIMVTEGLDALPERAGEIESPGMTWAWYQGHASGADPRAVDIATNERGTWLYTVTLTARPGEVQHLHDAVFLPAVKALGPAALDPEYVRQLEAHADELRRMIRADRALLRNSPWPAFPMQSDQQRGIPMPPREQPYDPSAPLIDLPAPDRGILAKSDLFQCIAERKSHRRYTDESLALPELAYLLWATQGVRKPTAGAKRIMRTVPSGGARHPFETYLAINRVEGLAPGVYRYLPLAHKLVHLLASHDLPEKLSFFAEDQSFVGQAAVCFIWSAVPYRVEWRYQTLLAKEILLDAGHVCQNLYLACESIGCGACAILAYRQEELDQFLGLDGEDELVVYLAPVGKVRQAREAAAARERGPGMAAIVEEGD